jgi:hypothetical protein
MRRPRRSRPGAAAGSPADAAGGLTDEIAQLRDLDLAALLVRWRNHVGGEPPAHLPKFLVARMLAFRLQEDAYGRLPVSAKRALERFNGPDGRGLSQTAAERRLRRKCLVAVAVVASQSPGPFSIKDEKIPCRRQFSREFPQ